MVSSITRLAAGLAAIAGVATFGVEPAPAQTSVKIGYALSCTAPPPAAPPQRRCPTMKCG
jgi:hypothetical protein